MEKTKVKCYIGNHIFHETEANARIVEVPSYLWDNALAEKKNTSSLDSYVFLFKHDGLPRLYELREYIQKLVGFSITESLERLK